MRAVDRRRVCCAVDDAVSCSEHDIGRHQACSTKCAGVGGRRIAQGRKVGEPAQGTHALRCRAFLCCCRHTQSLEIYLMHEAIASQHKAHRNKSIIYIKWLPGDYSVFTRSIRPSGRSKGQISGSLPYLPGAAGIPPSIRVCPTSALCLHCETRGLHLDKSSGTQFVPEDD